MSTTDSLAIGDGIRIWRQRRRMSQMDLAMDAEISPRHLSFIETGRSRPGRDVVLRLSEVLGVPLRERNVLLAAAGFAPLYRERPLAADGFAAVRATVERILEGHAPFPALAIDRHWTLLMANAAVLRLVAGVDPGLLEPPVNVLRLALHPAGLAPRTVNLAEWRRHLLVRLAHEVDLTGDAGLAALLQELRAYPAPASGRPNSEATAGGIAVPFIVEVEGRRLSFLSATTVFGTAVDVTLSELAIEAFFPADAETGAILQAMARQV